MSLFWDYFRKVLQFPLIWKPGPLAQLAKGGAEVLDQARTAALWLRDQFLPEKSAYLKLFALSRGLLRFPEERDEDWFNRVVGAFLFWKFGGTIPGLQKILVAFGYMNAEIVELADPEWAEFEIIVGINESSPNNAYLIKIVNEVKPARSVLKQIGLTSEKSLDPVKVNLVVASYIKSEAVADPTRRGTFGLKTNVVITTYIIS